VQRIIPNNKFKGERERAGYFNEIPGNPHRIERSRTFWNFYLMDTTLHIEEKLDTPFFSSIFILPF